MKKITFLGMLLCFSLPLFSQTTEDFINSNWYLPGPNESGITFDLSVSPAIPSLLPEGSIGFPQSGTNNFQIATVSDDDGNLLFFSDGLNVFDANRNLMTNGGLLNNAEESRYRRSIIVPSLIDENQYYLFIYAAGAGVNYSIIDISRNGGLGEVILRDSMLFRAPDVPISTNSLTSTLPPNSNARAALSSYYNATENVMWVAIYFGEEFLFFKMNSCTFNIVPDATDRIMINTPNQNFTVENGLRVLRISPNGQKIALGTLNVDSPSTRTSDIVIADFNAANSVSTPNERVFSMRHLRQHGPTDIEFSPNSQFLYIRRNIISRVRSNINIFPDSSYGPGIDTVHVTQALYGVGTLQIGPQDKIYYNSFDPSVSSPNSLGVIENPNEANNANLVFNDRLLVTIDNPLWALPKKVFDVDVQSDFPYPKKFIRGGSKQQAYNVVVDKNDDIIITNTNANTLVELDNTRVTHEYFMAKYAKNGCLIWVVSITDFESEVQVDEDNNILVRTGSNMSKYASNGDLLWSQSVMPSNYWQGGFDFDQNNDIYSFTDETRVVNKMISKLKSNDGSYSLIDAHVPNNFAIQSIMLSKTTSEVYVYGNYSSGANFSFGSSIVSSPVTGYSNYYILKYNIDSLGSHLTPVKAILLDGFRNVVYISNLNELYLNDRQGNVTILNNNLESIHTITSLSKGNYMRYNETLNTVTIMDYSGEEFDRINVNTRSFVNTITSIPDISNKYSHLQFDQNSEGKYFIMWAELITFDMNFQKLDPDTGDLLARGSNNTKQVMRHEFDSETSKIFPNPFINDLYILESIKKPIESVEIFNAIGKSMFFQKIDSTQKKVLINTERIVKKGLYFLKIRYSNGSTKIERVFKD